MRVSTTRCLPLLATLLVALAFGACAKTQQAAGVQRLQARAAFERGIKHFNDRDGAQALAALREAVALDPTSALYADTLGLVLLQLQRPDLALEQFEQAVRLDPQFADAHFHAGVARAESARWQEAAEAYRKALALPTLTVPALAHQNLGLALYHLRQYADAERELRFAISLSPDMQAAYYHLGLTLAAQMRLDQARLSFSRARALGPDTPFGDAAARQLRTLGEGGPGP